MHNNTRLLTRVFSAAVLLVQDWGTWWYEPPTTLSGAPNSPTTMTCAAWAKNGQQCRRCERALADDGTYKGYLVCGWTPTSESCRCDYARTPSCRGMASCEYWP
jgi:hypothetical protein